MSYYGYCPECGSQLKLIESNDGDFLRCTEYPYCSYVKKWNFYRFIYHYIKRQQRNRCRFLCCLCFCKEKGRYARAF